MGSGGAGKDVGKVKPVLLKSNGEKVDMCLVCNVPLLSEQVKRW